jgi:hypothetical protein
MTVQKKLIVTASLHSGSRQHGKHAGGVNTSLVSGARELQWDLGVGKLLRWSVGVPHTGTSRRIQEVMQPRYYYSSLLVLKSRPILVGHVDSVVMLILANDPG